jgi:hypothetical protein
MADAAAPENCAGDEAGYGPDAFVGLVFCSTRPRDSGAQQALVDGTRLDRAPAGGLPVQIGYEAARLAGLGLTARGLLAQPVGTFLIIHRTPL